MQVINVPTGKIITENFTKGPLDFLSIGDYGQAANIKANEEGVLVLVSRQAIHECAAQRDILQAELKELKSDRQYIIGFSHGYEEAETQITAEQDKLKEALQWILDNGELAHKSNITGVAKEALKGGA